MTLRTDVIVVEEVVVVVVVVSHHLDIKFNVDAMKVLTFALTHSSMASSSPKHSMDHPKVQPRTVPGVLSSNHNAPRLLAGVKYFY